MTKNQLVEIGLKYGRIKTEELVKQLGTTKASVISYVYKLRKAGVNIPRLNIVNGDFKEAVEILKKKLNVKGA